METRKFRTILITFSALATLAGGALSCKSRFDASRSGAANIKNSNVAAFEAGPACKDACSNIGDKDDKNWAVCYSCKCKAAMDGWLPSREEVSCNAAELIPVYQAIPRNGQIELRELTDAAPECFNPPRLPNAYSESGGCIPGSKLGQMQRGDIFVKWICRREHVHNRLFDPLVNYEDHGIIMHNSRTGATCYYDDVDNVTNGENNPDIDLTSGDPEKVTRFLDTYYRHEGSNCAGCHDNDPFMYSPYLKGANWQTSEAYTLGKYFAVRTKDPEKSHVVELTAPKAEPCLACHRIGQGRTCRTFSMDSAGMGDHPGLHSWLKRKPASDQGNGVEPESGADPIWGIANDPSGHAWPYPVWMPPQPGSSESLMVNWQRDYAEAVQTIQTCCENHDAPGCTWKQH